MLSKIKIIPHSFQQCHVSVRGKQEWLAMCLRRHCYLLFLLMARATKFLLPRWNRVTCLALYIEVLAQVSRISC